jgi:hypothetical protein
MERHVGSHAAAEIKFRFFAVKCLHRERTGRLLPFTILSGKDCLDTYAT